MSYLNLRKSKKKINLKEIREEVPCLQGNVDENYRRLLTRRHSSKKTAGKVLLKN